MISRPSPTTPYAPKLRLLITDACIHTCPFCHNEGQPRGKQELDLARLSLHLPSLRKHFSSVTLTGGEPLQASHVNQVIAELDRLAFDVTIDTAGADFQRLSKRSLSTIKHIHCSIISLGSDAKLASCNGAVSEKIKHLRDLRQAWPMLGMCINIPFVAPESQLCELESMLDLAQQLGASLKFIGELRFRGLKQSGQSSWIDRWGALATRLEALGFQVIGCNPREVELLSDETGVSVSCADIACAAVDPEFSGGRCFGNMDLTIDSNAEVKMCRWTEGGMPVEDFLRDITEGYRSTVNTNVQDCPHQIQLGRNSLIAASPAQVFTTHGDWPRKNGELQQLVSTELLQTSLRSEFSDFGRDGQTRRFEALLCDYFESPFSLTACSGAAALRLAFAACELGPEHEVVVPAISYGGAVAPVLETGARIRFCDVDSRTGRPSTSDILAVVGPRTRAILVTHLWGRPVDVPALKRALGRSDVLVIEDASHAAGGRWHGRPLGTLGDIGCFSLQANKALFAGEGGFALTASRELFERMIINGMLRKRIADDVRSPRYRQYWLTGAGTKQKLHPMGAAIGIASLQCLDQEIRRRQSAMEILAEAVGTGDSRVRFDTHGDGESPAAYYRPRIAVQSGAQVERDRVVGQLITLGAQVSVSELVPLNRAPVFRDHSSEGPAEFEGATRYLASTFGVPNLSVEDGELLRWYASILRIVANGGLGDSPLQLGKSRLLRTIPIGIL